MKHLLVVVISLFFCQSLMAQSETPSKFEPNYDHGPDSVELVSTLRSESANVCEEHLLGQAGGLQEGDTEDLREELHRAPVSYQVVVLCILCPE